MRLRAFDEQGIAWMTMEDHDTIFRRGPGFTLRVNGRIVLAAGIVQLWAGRGEAWMLTTQQVLRYPKLCLKLVRQYFRSICLGMQFRRIEATTGADYAIGRRWLEHLGFRLESEMPKFGLAGETYVRYVYFFEES